MSSLRPRWMAAVVVIAACVAPPGLADEPRSFSEHPALAELPEGWRGTMDLFDVPGGVVFAVLDGEVYVEAFGVRDPETGAPVTPDTMFYIASITKTYNATAVCRLADEGRLSLDDRVKDHLPELDLPDDELEESLTIGDLLCHRYGLASPPCNLLDAFTGEITDERYFHWMHEVMLARGRPSYNNLHFTLLGRVIEVVTGMDWRDYLGEGVLRPAGLARTTGYASRMYADPDVAFPCVREGDGFRRADLIKTDRTMHAAGGLGTTAIDAARYMMMHLGDGAIDGARILGAGTARAMRSRHAETGEARRFVDTFDAFGYAWHVGELLGRPTISHGGGYTGASAYFIGLPEDGVAVGVMMNGSGLANGWGEIVLTDIVSSLVGAAPDPARRVELLERARARRAHSGEEPGVVAGPRGLPSGALSRPIGMYTGWFRNEHLGTIVVRREGGSLRFAMGNLGLEAEPGAAPDRFTLDILGTGVPAAFVLTDDGWVEGIRLEHPQLRPHEFAR